MPKNGASSLVALLSLLAAPWALAQTSYPYAIHTLAGNGVLGDGGPANSALLEYPQSVAVDPTGKIYVGDTGDARIRLIQANGNIQTVATGAASCMKSDSTGAIYASDGYAKIYKISSRGDVIVFAGTDLGFSGDNGPAASAKFYGLTGIAIDALNNVYVADTYNQRIRKISPSGTITTIAGNGAIGFGKDNIPALQSPFEFPSGVEVDAAGNIYVSEIFRIRKINTDGTITTIAGNGTTPTDGPAISSGIGSLVALAIDKASNLYLADADFNMVRMISPSGRISTLAGSTLAGFAGDGSYGFKTLLHAPVGIAVDAQSNIFVADELNHRIREITALGLVSTVAGASHFGGDGGPATAALVHRPESVIKDGAGNLIISDTDNHRIRKIDTQGVITTIAGTGECDYGGDLGKATLASLCFPEGLAFDAAGNLYVADWGNYVVRRIAANGIITTIAGSNKSGDQVTNPPTSAKLAGPFGLAVDPSGVLFISDDMNQRIYALTLPSGSTSATLSNFAGKGTAAFSGDGGLSTAAELDKPRQLAVGPDGSLYISDWGTTAFARWLRGSRVPVPASSRR